MRRFLIQFVNIYQKIFHPFKRPSCKFYPTCSEYMKISIKRHGLLGLWYGLKRIARCHPWQENQVDLPK